MLGRIEDRAARFGKRKLYRICWQTIFVSEIRQVADTVRIRLVSRTFLTPRMTAAPRGIGAFLVSRASSVGRNRISLTRVNSEKQRVNKRVAVRASGAEPLWTLNHNQMAQPGGSNVPPWNKGRKVGPKAGIASARGSADPRPVADGRSCP